MKMAICVWAGLCLVMVGCGRSGVVGESTGDPGGQASTDSAYLSRSEPTEVIPVGQARESTLDGQQVSVIGVIGGSQDPFVEGLAAFTIVDPEVPYCAADEGCPTPWDYCCTQDQVAGHLATVKIVDAQGTPLAQDARELIGVAELATVVATGKAERDDQGNLSVAATEVFVKQRGR